MQGCTRPDPTEVGDDGLLARTVQVGGLGPQYETCNIVYPRSLPHAKPIDGVEHDGFGRPARGDAERARQARSVSSAVLEALGGFDERVRPAARVRTPWWRRPRWPGIRVFAEHPQTRVILYRRVFWNVWHYLLWRSLIALLAPAWLRRMLLTMHLLELRKRARGAGAGAGERGGAGVSAVPFLIVHDLVECWAVARGAARYRTLVL